MPEKSRDFLLWAGGPGVVAFFVVHRAQKARFALRPRTSSVTAWLAFLVFEDVEVFTRIDLYYLTLFYTLLISMGFAMGLAIMEAQATDCPFQCPATTVASSFTHRPTSPPSSSPSSSR